MTYPPDPPAGPTYPQQPYPPQQPYVPTQAYPPQQGYPPAPGYPPPPGYPPAPYAPPRKSNAGKIILLVLGILVVLCGGGVVAVVVIGGNAAKNAVNPAAVHAGLNKAARDGKFEFVVTKVTCGIPRVGDDALNKTAQGQFCEVTLSVKNISGQPQTFAGAFQKAKGPDGTTYADDTAAEVYANEGTPTFLAEINPGNGVTGTLVFDIPKTATIRTLELHDSPFSGGVIVTVS